MPGAIDANGVYLYDETDLLSPFSSFMNLGQNAASALALRAPRGVLPNGFASISASSTINATSSILVTPVDVPGLSAAVTVGTNRRIRIVFDGNLMSTVALDQGQLGIREGSTMLAANTVCVLNTATRGYAGHLEAILAPTPGPHTYKIALGRASGTGSINVQAGTVSPAFILVEDIGTTS